MTQALSASGHEAPASSSLTAGLRPHRLHCEGRLAPGAIDVPHPAFSWQLAAPPASRGARQTACHLLVATSRERLSPSTADRWDSGVVESDCTAIQYNGAALQSLEQCYWAVRVRNEKGEWSHWETSGSWSMGLLNPDDEWRAAWIYLPPYTPSAPPSLFEPRTSPPPDPWFRREIQLDAVPRRAVALVASVGFHELHVNGRKVSDHVLAPNVCDGSTRAFYVRYDIESYLRPGPNMLALWLGAGWSVYAHFQKPDRPSQPLVSAQFYFDNHADTEPVVTDSSWLARPSPSRLIGTWEFRNFGGECYDATAEVEGWAEPGSSSTGWAPAATGAFRLPISADPAEPNRRQVELRPAAIVESEPGVYRVDFGRNFAGFLEVGLTAPPGSRIALESSEADDRAMTYSIRSEYIVGPSGRGVFQNRFNYAVGRWLTLRGLSAPPDPTAIRAWCVRNDYRAAARFESSDQRLNAIAATTCWTFENLTIGGFVADCPHRERMGYGGDGHSSLIAGLYHYRLDAFFDKWNRDWHDVQGHPPAWSSIHDPTAVEPPPSMHPGEMPYTAPTYWGGGGPAWSGFCVHLPWQHYRFYGDRRILERSLPVVTRWLDFLETKVSDGLLKRWGGKWDFLGDWLMPNMPRGVNSDRHETLFFNNCYRVWSLATATKMARVLGENDLAERWTTQATRAREAIHAAFHEPAANGYADSSQVSLAVALLAGIPPASLRPAIEQRLDDEIRRVRQGHIDAGITGGALLFHYLLENRRHDLLHLLVSQPGYPGWWHMIDRGATTLWETWEEPAGNLSGLHSSFLYVGGWPIGGVLGLLPDENAPGFKKVRIVPGPTGDPELTWARGHFDSVRGRIAVAWRSDSGVFTLEVELPPGIEAEIALPTGESHAATESGRPLREMSDVVLRHEAACTLVTVPSGSYRFQCPIGCLPAVPT